LPKQKDRTNDNLKLRFILVAFRKTPHYIASPIQLLSDELPWCNLASNVNKWF